VVTQVGHLVHYGDLLDSARILQNPESLPDADVTWTMAGGLVTHADA
jgi:hypothetical protein